MDPQTDSPATLRPDYRRWLRGSLILLALLVIARFVLEVAGASHRGTSILSTTAFVFLAAVYLGAIAPLRRVTRTVQLIVPAAALAVWTQAWVMLATILTFIFRIERSHYLHTEEFGSWGSLGRHLMGHVVETLVFAVLVFVLMSIVFFLRRWPVTVGPGAVLGILVILRYWMEAMGVAEPAPTAMSSTVGILASAVYLGGIGAKFGLSTLRQFLGPALALGWVWRLWIFLVTLLSALVPFYKTHFFDPSQGQIAWRLVRFILGSVLIEGLIAGLLVWAIAIWISRATRPSPPAVT
jgi:hypothetical protein